MIDGIFTQDLKPVDAIMPYPPYPSYPAGTADADKGYFRYAKKASEFPNLTIIDPIYGQEGEIILPGYYGLILSDDRNFLVLVQSEKVMAVFPVFKLEEDKVQLERERDKKYIKAQAKKHKAQAKINEKRAKRGLPPVEDEVYMKASIEYDKFGEYYLVKYERGRIRAWGAIKE